MCRGILSVSYFGGFCVLAFGGFCTGENGDYVCLLLGGILYLLGGLCVFVIWGDIVPGAFCSRGILYRGVMGCIRGN